MDDSEDVREFLALVLESGGHRVSQASDARGGLELAGRLRPDVVITDVAKRWRRA